MTQHSRSASRRDGAGLWLVAGSVGVSLLALLLVLVVLVSQALQAFALQPVAALQWRSAQGSEQALMALVAQDASHLILRRSELERAGGAYVRIARSDVLALEYPPDGVSLRLLDGREMYLRGDAAALRALAPDARVPVPGLASQDAPLRADLHEILAPNTLGTSQRAAIVAARVWRFVRGAPGAGAEAFGLFPALVGTVVLVVLMSVIVMPLGVLVALWLHEYAGRGPLTQLLRAAIANLAGIPSVIYGFFGLVFFVHTLGAGIDHAIFGDTLSRPTFGAGGLLWSALTLALLTLPVVIIATGEGLARVPPGMRQGALALGATRAEALWRVVLPMAQPALLTGLILAIARAAGEVAPLMLVGVVKYAPGLPVDGEFPYLHLSRQFMHLGHTVYDRALAGNDALRDMPQAYAAAALLLLVVVSLNASAILVRNRLRERSRQLAS